MDWSDLVLEIVVCMNNQGINFSDKVLPERNSWMEEILNIGSGQLLEFKLCLNLALLLKID